ncbi:MAG: MBOAT family protein [Planctomycetes bacterium]|nr:MBOAT family protein [Planctomycetota bacterium]
MSFAQYEYLPFLLAVLAVFQLTPASARKAVLLIASFCFYVYWQPWHGLLLGASIVCNFVCATSLERASSLRARRAWLALALSANLGLLIVFKYGGFVVDNVNALLAQFGAEPLGRPNLALPLGLSFYTFQGLGYVIDVWRRRIPACRSAITFALYASFFPPLVAGPIERAEHLLPQLERLVPLRSENAWVGSRRVLWGLFKKWVLADQLRSVVWPVFSTPEAHGSAGLLVALFGMQAVLYLDFSAYTDIARGSARLFGVELVENFRRPFAARSFAELAQRWHISLYTWIRDYAFAPLFGSRLSHATIWRNNLLVMGAFGLWHGASWSFLVWGLAGGAVIASGHSWRLARTRAGVRRAPGGGAELSRLGSWTSTLFFAALFMVLFFGPDLRFAGQYYARLFGFAGSNVAELTQFVLPVGALLSLALAVHVAGEKHDLEALWNARSSGLRMLALLALAAATLFLRVPDPLPFIYFRF